MKVVVRRHHTLDSQLHDEASASAPQKPNPDMFRVGLTSMTKPQGWGLMCQSVA